MMKEELKMQEPLKLLNEDYVAESKFLYEELNGEKFMCIEGPFLGAEKRNRNGRIYPRQLIEREVKKYKELIDSQQAVGELNHPDSAEVNPERAAILITKLDMQEDLAMGKARILPTSCGDTLRNLIRGGVRMGVSSRGTGNLGSDNIVAEDYSLITIDAVLQPSCPDAYVNAVLEQTKWVLDESSNLYVEKRVRMVDAAKQFDKTISDGGSKKVVEAFKTYFSLLKNM